MAEVSTSRRAIAGIVLAIAGALLLVDILLGFANINALDPWLTVLAWVAIAAAFLILAIASFRNTIARIALIVSAVGFLLLALANAGVMLPDPLGLVANIAAAAGMLVAAIVLYAGKEIQNLTAIVFVVTAIVFAIIVLLSAANITVDAALVTILSLLFGIGVLVTGILFARVQGARGR
jgi:hypothetical protein